MIEFLTLMGLKRTAFLAGLILYIILILIILCTDFRKKSSVRDPDKTAPVNEVHTTGSRFVPQDAYYCEASEDSC